MTTIYARRGDLSSGELWLRTAVDASGGNAMTTFNLGLLLKIQGRPEEAEPWLLRAAEAGHSGAAFHLGGICAARDELLAAERWFRTWRG